MVNRFSFIRVQSNAIQICSDLGDTSNEEDQMTPLPNRVVFDQQIL